MADLVTHLAVVLLPGSFVRRSSLVAVVAVATTLPDALGRGVPLALEHLYGAGWPIPEAALWPWSSLHEPAGWLLVGLLVAMAFVDKDRWPVLAAAWLGGALHTAIDVLQDHHGVGYLLFAPLTDRGWELGRIGSEATVPYAMPLAALTAIAWVPRAAGCDGLAWRLVPAAAVAAGVLVAVLGWGLLASAPVSP